MESRTTTRATLSPLAMYICFLLSSLCCGFAKGELPKPKVGNLSCYVAQQGSSCVLELLDKTNVFGPSTLIFSDDRLQATPQYLSGEPVSANAPLTPADGKFTVHIPNDLPSGHYTVQAQTEFGLSNSRPFLVTTSPVVDLSIGQGSSAVKLQEGIVYQSVAKSESRCIYQIQISNPTALLITTIARGIDSRANLIIKLLDTRRRTVAVSRSNENEEATLAIDRLPQGNYTVEFYDSLYRGGNDYPFLFQTSVGTVPELAQRPAAEPANALENLAENVASERTYEPLKRWKQVREFEATRSRELRRVSLDFVEIEHNLANLTLPELPKSMSASQLDEIAMDKVSNAIESNNHGIASKTQSDDSGKPVAQKLKDENDFVCVSFSIEDYSKSRSIADIELTAGQEVAIDFISQRLGFATDLFTRVAFVGSTEAKNSPSNEVHKADRPYEVVATSDEPAAVGAVEMRLEHRDPAFIFTATKNGIYRIMVDNRQTSSRNHHPHIRNAILYIRSPSPRFKTYTYLVDNVRQSESSQSPSPTIWKGESLAIRTTAVRLEGFQEPINVKVESDRESSISSVATIPRNADSVVSIIKCEATEFTENNRTSSMIVTCQSVIDSQPIQQESNYREIIRGGIETFNRVSHRNTSKLQIAQSKSIAIPTSISLMTNSNVSATQPATDQQTDVDRSIANSTAMPPRYPVGTPIKFTARVSRPVDSAAKSVIRLKDLPSKCNASDLTLDSQTNEGELTLNVAGDAEPGIYSIYGLVETKAKITATSNDLPALQTQLQSTQSLDRNGMSGEQVAVIDLEIKELGSQIAQIEEFSREKEHAVQLVSTPARFELYRP